MSQKLTLQILPHGGLNTKINPSDYSLTKAQDKYGGIILTNDVGGYNWDISERMGEVRKIPGYQKWGSAAASTGDCWQELFVLDDGTNITNCGVYDGKFYTIGNSGAFTNYDALPSVTFHDTDPICMVAYGSYVLISSLSEYSYKWKFGDPRLTPLIGAGTNYKFKFLEQFQNRIIGAYTDETTGGNISIRWTTALPDMTALEFTSSNQTYKPDSDVGITGMKRMGNMRLMIYGRSTIYSADYFPDYPTTPFDLSPVATEVGTDSHFSIVDTGRSHCFFDRNKGFVEFSSANTWKPLSLAIDPIIDTIDSAYYGKIVGKYSRLTNQICWAVPINGASTPNALLYYNLNTEQWRQVSRDVTAFLFDKWYLQSGETWTELRADSPQTPKWPSSGSWSDYLDTDNAEMVFGNTTGYIYHQAGDSADGSDFAAYRIEPILSQPDATRHKRIQEFHLEVSDDTECSVDVYWRGARTQQATENLAWELLGSVSCSSSSENVLYFDKTAKYHQFKWGTDLKDERFKVSRIILKGYAL